MKSSTELHEPRPTFMSDAQFKEAIDRTQGIINRIHTYLNDYFRGRKVRMLVDYNGKTRFHSVRSKRKNLKGTIQTIESVHIHARVVWFKLSGLNVHVEPHEIELAAAEDRVSVVERLAEALAKI